MIAIAIFIYLYTLWIVCIAGFCGYLIMLKYKKPKRLPALYTVSVAIDCAFILKEKKLIIESLIQWQEASNGLVTFHLINMDMKSLIQNETEGYAINIIKVLSEDKEVKKWDKENGRIVWGYAHGYKPCGLAFLVADRLKNSTMFTSTCGHEIGHLLGLPHNPNSNTLMYKYIRGLKPTQLDINELVLLWRRWIIN